MTFNVAVERTAYGVRSLPSCANMLRKFPNECAPLLEGATDRIGANWKSHHYGCSVSSCAANFIGAFLSIRVACDRFISADNNLTET